MLRGQGFEGICVERRPPFEDDVVRYYGQYVALAVADTFEAAKAAADAVGVTYDKDKPNVETDLIADDDPEVIATTYGPEPRLQSERGDAEAAFANAPVKLDQTYVTPAETHNPIELQATIAMWDGPRLTLYEESQGVFNMRGVLAQMFGLPKENVRVITKFVGFVEVTWQPEIAQLRVSRVVTVIDAGRIVNPLAGRNQIEGAVVMGIGMALLEHTTYDPQNGAPINSNLTDYIVAVNADVPKLDVHFLDFPDKEINQLGARGIGEIGLAGIAAAITSAVYHATGVRVRELPIRIEDLLNSSVLV